MLVFLFILGCQEVEEKSTEINYADYNTTCEVDGDCVAVATGDVCHCFCSGQAINVEDLDEYSALVGELSEECDGYGPDCAECEPTSAYCNEGTCAVQYEY